MDAEMFSVEPKLSYLSYLPGALNRFPDFVQTFKIVIDSWKFTMLLLYILWDDWSIFMISGSKEQLKQELEYTLLKPDCHSWWISKMQSGLVSLFNGISTLFRLFNAKAILLEEQ